MIAIVDYGVGNLFSLVSSLKALGLAAEVTGDAVRLQAADRIILPGVGAFGDARKKLDDTGLVPVLLEEAERKPLLGICLGMQLLFERSFEYGEHPGLGLVPGQVADLRQDLTDRALKVPHMGWNSLRILRDDPLFRYVEDGEYVYYVHSYYARDCRPSTLGGVPVRRCGRHRRGPPGERLGHPVPPGEVRGHGAAAAESLRRTVRGRAMRPMRRQDRAVTDPEKISAVIGGCQVLRLGLQDGKGVYVVPVNFGHVLENGRHVSLYPRRRRGPEGGSGAAERLGRVRAGRRLRPPGGGGGLRLHRRVPQRHRRGAHPRGGGPVGEAPGPGRRHAPGHRPGRTGPSRTGPVDAVCVLRLEAAELACKEHL